MPQQTPTANDCILIPAYCFANPSQPVVSKRRCSFRDTQLFFQLPRRRGRLPRATRGGNTIRQFGRVVKALDLKSNGHSPRGFARRRNNCRNVASKAPRSHILCVTSILIIVLLCFPDYRNPTAVVVRSLRAHLLHLPRRQGRAITCNS